MTQVDSVQAGTLDVQSVLYLNKPGDITRAAEFTSNSVRNAKEQGLISGWRLLLGDCSPGAILDETSLAEIEGQVVAAGGTLVYRYFGNNLGSAAGHNALAKGGTSDRILILNPDALTAYDTVSNLWLALLPGVGIAESRQVPIEHPKDYEPSTGNTSWASTACALTTRVGFEELKGFDSDSFFLYCDDVDYSWRLRLAGYRVIYVPEARVFHDKRLTQTGGWPTSSAEVYYSAEAALLLAHKYSRPDLVKKISHALRSSSEESVRRAVDEYERRATTGTTPTPIDVKHRVAEFVDGNYAVHRF